MTQALRSPAPAPAAGETSFSDADFARVAAIAHREFGLFLPDSKKDLVYSRLIKRLRQTGDVSFQAYCDRIESGQAPQERAELISSLTTNVTHFFREEHHFRLLTDLVVKPRLQGLAQGTRLRIWSAGCSAGPEPYSLAMTLRDVVPDAARLNARILATDIDPAILAKARAASYSDEEAQGIPDRLRPAMTERSPDGRIHMARKVTDLVHFAELNLMGDWPVKGPFDAIFCRNVAIYFDKTTQARLWHRFAALLAPGGLLCIGHSERLSGPATDHLTSAGITAYRRTSTSVPPPPAKDPTP